MTRKEIAEKAGVNASTLGQLVSGYARVGPNDSRIIRVGEVLGLAADECFDDYMPLKGFDGEIDAQ